MNKYLVLLIFLIISYLVFGSFLSIIGMGIIFSMALYPLFHKNLLKLSPSTNSLLITFLFGVLVIGPTVLLIIIGSSEMKDFILSQDLSKTNEISLMIYQKLENNRILNLFFQDENFNFLKFNEVVSQNIFLLKKKIVENLQSSITMIPSIVFAFLIICLTIYFTLIDSVMFKKIFTKNRFYSEHFGSFIVKETVEISRTVVIAVLVSSIIQTTIILIPALFFNLNSIILISFATFFMGMIPIVGTAPVIIYLIISHFLNQNIIAAVFYVIFGIIIGLTDNIFRAKFIEKKSKIHPLIAFLSTVGGIKLFGFFGIFLGPIIVVISIKALGYVSFIKSNK